MVGYLFRSKNKLNRKYLYYICVFIRCIRLIRRSIYIYIYMCIPKVIYAYIHIFWLYAPHACPYVFVVVFVVDHCIHI